MNRYDLFSQTVSQIPIYNLFFKEHDNDLLRKWQDCPISQKQTQFRIPEGIRPPVSNLESAAIRFSNAKKVEEAYQFRFADPGFRTLPDFFRRVLILAEDDDMLDTLLLGTLGVLSSTLYGVHGSLLNENIQPNLYIFITGAAASGKGRINLCRNLIKPIERCYPSSLFVLPGNSSDTAIYEELANNGGRGIIAAIALVQAVRRVPVQYAKRVVGNRQYGGVRQYIPLKINAAGVMPIIFAQALMLFPILFSRWDATRGLAATLGNYTGFWYNFLFFILVVIFTYFYTAVTVNPTMMAEDMKRNSGFIPGVKPGKKTVEYLDTIMSRVTLPGSIFLGIISILPAFAMIAGVNNQFASFFGGTSLLILVGVVLDTLQQVESYLLMRHYDGLMKTGRLSGRSGM